MKVVSRIALGVALSFGASSFAFPALAQQPAAAQAAPAQKQLQLSKAEREGLMPLSAAVEAKNWTAAAAALPAAQAAAKGADARYALGSLQLQLGLGTSNVSQQAHALEIMIASGGVPPENLVEMYKNVGALASKAGDKKKTEAAFTKWAELAPNDPEAVIALAEIRRDNGKPAEALPLLERAIQLRKAANQPVPESWYKVGLKIAYDGKMMPQALGFARQWVSAYPTQKNWRDTLLIYQESAKLDEEGSIDLLRLKRAAKALSGERDYYELAYALDKRGFPGETKAVLDEGIAGRMVDPKKAEFQQLLKAATSRIAEDKSTLAGLATKAGAAATGRDALIVADAFAGYGDYAKAVPLYRTALQKGSVDAELVNMRLGRALALTGQRAEAETAFRAVTGQRAELASYWLLWLNQSA